CIPRYTDVTPMYCSLTNARIGWHNDSTEPVDRIRHTARSNMGVFTRATASRSRTRTATLSGLAFLGASALVLTGCSSPGGGEGGDNERPEGDLTMKIGTLLPQTGQLAFLGPPEEAGVGLAVKEVNDADLGIEIDVTYGDSGDPDNKAFATTVPKLLGEGVSAIVGAASSGVTKLVIDEVTGAGVIQFSPANTSADFTT